MAANELTREELYDLAWSEPMQKLARRFSISDVRLAKVCRAADIPVPERGYWAKLQAGKAVEKAPLPPRGLGRSDTVTVRRSGYESHEDLTARSLTEPIPAAPTFAEALVDVIERVRKIVGKVTVPRGFDKIHPLIAKLLDEQEQRQQADVQATYGFMAPRPVVDPAVERRRVRILNGLFLSLQRCGCTPWIRDREKRETGVEVGHQNIGFTLEAVGQRSAAKRSKPSRWKLRLTIYDWDEERWTPKPGRSWSDADGTSLEQQVTEITVELIVAGEARYRRSVQARHEWYLKRRAELEEEERRRRAEEARLERERLARLQKERVDRLVNAAAKWRRAADLRAFVRAVQEASPTEDDHLNQWAVWALATADSIDPLLTGELRIERIQNDEAVR